MVILGIDPGSSIMGYGVIDVVKNQPVLLLMGTLDQRKVTDHYEKISRIFDRTMQLIKEYKPIAMAIESPFYGNNIQSMLKLGRAQGAAISAALHLSVKVFEYAPRKIKQSITGHGESSKEQIANLLQMLLKVDLKPETLDATDGLAAAMCHYYQLCNPVTSAASSSKGGKSPSKGWDDFIKKNPDRVSNS
jgi:crossover junction endodeoxyribonuclease RuvC